MSGFLSINRGNTVNSTSLLLYSNCKKIATLSRRFLTFTRFDCMSKKFASWTIFIILCIIWGSSFKLMQDSQAGPMQSLVVRRMTLGEHIQQAIHVQTASLWSLEPMLRITHTLALPKEPRTSGSSD